MANLIDGAVGIRWGSSQVRNSARDQNTIIDLLARIKEVDGGMAHLWSFRPLDGGEHQCPKHLHEAILRFQKVWVSKRSLNVADGVVDVGGSSLQLMNKLTLGSLILPPGGVVDDATIVDVIVAIVPMSHRPESVSSESLKAYILRNVITPTYRAKKRELVVIPLMPSSNFDPATILAQIKSLTGHNSSLGVTCMYGVSLGGLNVIDLAKITSKLFPLTYVGLSDCAFTHDDAIHAPIGLGLGGEIKPEMKSHFSNFTAKRKVNAFQHKGNIIKPTSQRLPPFIWSSNMFQGEIHGAVIGFQENYNLTSKVFTTEANQAHVDGARLGENIILMDLLKLLISV